MRPLILALPLLALSAPAFADGTCPNELAEAIEDYASARASHQAARSQVYDRDWKGRIGAAPDRDVAIANYEAARDALARARVERREARQAYKKTRRAHDVDPDTCTAQKRPSAALAPTDRAS